MPRELSQIEEDYIRDNYLKESVESIASKIKGVGVITIKKYIDECLPPPAEPEETFEERQRKLQSTRVSGSRLMGRDPERGVTVMTEAASEMIDARKVLALREMTDAQRKKNEDKIHRPFEQSPYDR